MLLEAASLAMRKREKTRLRDEGEFRSVLGGGRMVNAAAVGDVGRVCSSRMAGRAVSLTIHQRTPQQRLTGRFTVRILETYSL